MEVQVTKLLLLLLIVNYIQAVPKIDIKERAQRLHNQLKSKLHRRIVEQSRRQDTNGPHGDAGTASPNNNEYENVDPDIIAGRPNKASVSLRQKPKGDIKFRYKESRPLQIGDTITPEELLPVSRRLMKKVTTPGTGIVSSSKNEYELADKIFERFFVSARRIMVIQGPDIEGLDAFQALALDGEVITLRSPSESYTEKPSLVFKGFKKDADMKMYGLQMDDYPSKCHYKVLRKTVKEKPIVKTAKNKSALRGAPQLKKTLAKNRNLVVNPALRQKKKKKTVKGQHNNTSSGLIRSHNKKRGENTRLDQESTRQTSNSSTRSGSHEKSPRTKNHEIISSSRAKHTTDNEVTCRWKYRCAEEFHLQTCRLHPICSNQTEYKLAFINEEPDINLRRFREHVGISTLDEKVEKIIESHVLKTKHQSLKRDKKMEDLLEYFNKVVEALGYTTPMSNLGNEVHQLKNVEKDLMDSDMSPEVHTDPPSTSDDDDAEARRILGLPERKLKKYKLKNKKRH